MSRHVIIASIMHESHTFNPVATDRSKFTVEYGDEVLEKSRGTRTGISGFIDAAADYGWTFSIPINARATSGGRVTQAALDEFIACLEKAIHEQNKLDGIALVLHGAMSCEHCDDGDAEILRRVRLAAGDTVPIAATIDPHGNVSTGMTDNASILCTYRTTPHIDQYDTSRRAAQILHRAMLGEVNPKIVLARRPMLYAFDRGRTHNGHGPMVEALELAQRWEREQPGVLGVGVQAGFSHADTPQTGPSVYIVGDGDAPLYQDLAEQLIEFGWQNRQRETVSLVSLDEAMARARANIEKNPNGPPAVIGDYADSPGGGTPGNGTNMLRAMLAAKLTNCALGAINDPDVAAYCAKAGEGAEVKVSLGGKIAPEFGGGPLDITATVLKVSNGDYVHEGPSATGWRGSFGVSVLLQVEGIEVIVSSRNQNFLDTQQVRIFGIDPERKAVVSCKNMHHFRAGFTPLAADIMSCDSGGLTGYQYQRLTYHKLPRPIWPLDEPLDEPRTA
ncbi:MAG: M81 family metallopeptidase [Gammaproteobacteria bacterium]